MTPKQQYEARKAEREKLKDIDFNIQKRMETMAMLDLVDRFVTAIEQIAASMPSQD